MYELVAWEYNHKRNNNVERLGGGEIGGESMKGKEEDGM